MGQPRLQKLANKHQRTVAQVVLRWHIQLGNMVIPKSVTPARLKENMAIFDFGLMKTTWPPSPRWTTPAAAWDPTRSYSGFPR